MNEKTRVSLMEKAGRNRLIIDMVRQTGNGSFVAEHFGISRERVRQIWQEYGPSDSLKDAKPRSRNSFEKEARAKRVAERKAYIERMTAKCVEAYEGGYTQAQICERFGLGRGAVQHYLAQAGAYKHSRRCARDPKIIKLREQGMTCVAIARKLGAHQQTIYQAIVRLRKAGQIAA